MHASSCECAVGACLVVSVMSPGISLIFPWYHGFAVSDGLSYTTLIPPLLPSFCLPPSIPPLVPPHLFLYYLFLFSLLSSSSPFHFSLSSSVSSSVSSSLLSSPLLSSPPLSSPLLSSPLLSSQLPVLLLISTGVLVRRVATLSRPSWPYRTSSLSLASSLMRAVRRDTTSLCREPDKRRER